MTTLKNVTDTLQFEQLYTSAERFVDTFILEHLSEIRNLFPILSFYMICKPKYDN